MQVVVHVGGTAEFYIQERGWERIKAPACCPNCGGKKGLRSLGYYERSIASMCSVKCMRLQIRRFRCFNCGRTTSLLPSFCQPYRLLPSEMIESYFKNPADKGSTSWGFLLSRYWRCYTDWLEELRSRLNKDFDLKTCTQGPAQMWMAIEKTFIGLANATVKIVTKSMITLFGIYQCHQPFCGFDDAEKVHTTVLFRSGKDPPYFETKHENDPSSSF